MLDADALTSFAARTADAVLCDQARAGDDSPDAARGRIRTSVWLGTADEAASKLERAKAAAALLRRDRVAQRPRYRRGRLEGRVSIAENAPPMAGHRRLGRCARRLCRGLLAQEMPGFEAASAAAWMHGETGGEAGPGLISEDLPEALRAVYRRLYVDFGVWP